MINVARFAITWRRGRFCMPMVFLMMSFALCPTLHSQNTPNPLDKKISFSVNNIPFTDALRILREKTGLAISYNQETIQSQPNVTLTITDEPTRNILGKVLAHTNLQYMELPGGGVLIVP